MSPVWNETLQQWGFHFYESAEQFDWLGKLMKATSELIGIQ